MHMKKSQLISAYNKGQLDDVAKQLRRYGTIEKDKEWYENSGYYAGSHRVMHIKHLGTDWRLTLWNGEVKEVGYTI